MESCIGCLFTVFDSWGLVTKLFIRVYSSNHHIRNRLLFITITLISIDIISFHYTTAYHPYAFLQHYYPMNALQSLIPSSGHHGHPLTSLFILCGGMIPSMKTSLTSRFLSLSILLSPERRNHVSVEYSPSRPRFPL